MTLCPTNMSCPISKMTLIACSPWQCTTVQLATGDACRIKRWECAGWMVFGCHKKRSRTLKSPHLHCHVYVMVIDWYHQRAENFLCLRKYLFFSPRVFPGLFRSPSTMNKIPHLGLPKALCARKWHQPDYQALLVIPGKWGSISFLSHNKETVKRADSNVVKSWLHRFLQKWWLHKGYCST